MRRLIGTYSVSGRDFQVDHDGILILSVIGRIKISGCTGATGDKLVENIYRDNRVLNPIVELKTANLKINVLAKSRTQGNFSLARTYNSMFEMTSTARGIIEKAGESYTRITRGTKKKYILTGMVIDKLLKPRILQYKMAIQFISLKTSRQPAATTAKDFQSYFSHYYSSLIVR